MLKYKITKIFMCFCIFFSFNTAFSSQEIESLKKVAENNIQSCEQSYQNAKALRPRLEYGKKPGAFASRTTKNAYANSVIYMKIFDSEINDFTNFTNKKINIRLSKNLEELNKLLKEYTIICGTRASQLVGFVDWATTGKADPALKFIYEAWVRKAKEEKK